MNTPANNHSPLEVGQRLRALRDERRISLRELGRLSGISINALSQIERGLTSPSVSTLYKLVDALGVPITALFRAESMREEIVFRSAQNRTQVPFPLGLWEGLGGEDFLGKMQPFMVTLEPGADSGSHLIMHTGHEFVLGLKGTLEYRVEGQIFFLEPGDSLLFAARLRHCWRNPGDSQAVAVIVLAGFEEYESPMDFHLTAKSENHE